MTKQPLIGITAGEIVNTKKQWAPYTHGQSYTYIDAIIHAGGIPVILPISGEQSVWQGFYDHCDGILFAGGNDIDPDRYKQKKHKKTSDISKFRDEQEFALLEIALKGDKPLLAICRGMQLLNVGTGGSLFQHVPDQVESASDHEASNTEKDIKHMAHFLKIDPSSKLAGFVGTEPLGTNTHHHQAVDSLGEGLVATAWAEDGIVEGAELPGDRFVVAVQSHPESLEGEAEPRWAGLFKAFVDAAR